ncbi:MAG: DoxX family protein [Pseudonocardia sp.]
MSPTNPTITDATTASLPSRAAIRTGWVLTALVTLFLLFDSVTKLIKIPMVVEGTVKLGFPESAIRVMGVLLLVGVLLYLVPRTSVFGAVFVTAYLGGAVCANVRVEAPLFGYVLFPVYVALLLWLGLYLRSAALRRLVRTGY